MHVQVLLMIQRLQKEHIHGRVDHVDRCGGMAIPALLLIHGLQKEHVDANVWTDLEDACTRPVDHTRSAVGTRAHMWTHLGMHVQVY